jgi:hypothetical protein
MKIELKDNEIFEVNKEMTLVADTLGRPSNFPEKDQFKLFIQYVKQTYAGYHIATNNGIISIDFPSNYLYPELHFNTRTYEDGTIVEELFVSALQKAINYDGKLLDVERLMEIRTDSVEHFEEDMENDDYNHKNFLEELFYYDGVDDLMNQTKELQEEIEKDIFNWKSLVEFRWRNK